VSKLDKKRFLAMDAHYNVMYLVAGQVLCAKVVSADQTERFLATSGSRKWHDLSHCHGTYSSGHMQYESVTVCMSNL